MTARLNSPRGHLNNPRNYLNRPRKHLNDSRNDLKLPRSQHLRLKSEFWAESADFQGGRGRR
jgi:hypothetical protein